MSDISEGSKFKEDENEQEKKKVNDVKSDLDSQDQNDERKKIQKADSASRCRNLLWDKNRKYFTVSASVLLLLVLIFIVVYFTVLMQPTLVWKTGRQRSILHVSKNCVKNIQKDSNGGEMKSEGDCYTQHTMMDITTHSDNGTHVVQNLQMTNLTQVFDNGTVLSLDTFIQKVDKKRLRFLIAEESDETTQESGLEHINKIGNGQVICDTVTGEVTGMNLASDTHPLVAQAMLQVLQNTNTGFVDEVVPAAAKRTITSLAGQANDNQKVEQQSSTSYWSGTKTVMKRAVPQNENDLQLEQETTFNSEGQVQNSTLNASRSITQQSDDNSTLSLQGETTQQATAVNETTVDDDEIIMQQELLKRQNLTFYDARNVSLASASAETKALIIEKSEESETLLEPEDHGGRLLADIMEGSKPVLVQVDYPLNNQVVLGICIEWRADIYVWKLKEVNKYRIAMIVKEYVNGGFTKYLHIVDKVIEIKNCQALPLRDVIKTVIFDIWYPIGGLWLHLIMWQQTERQSYAEFMFYPDQQMFHFRQVLMDRSTVNGIASLSTWYAEAGIAIQGIRSDLTLYKELKVYPSIVNVVLYKGEGRGYSVYGFFRVLWCRIEHYQVCWCWRIWRRRICVCVWIPYPVCELSPPIKLFEYSNVKVKETVAQFQIIGSGALALPK